YVAEIFKHQRTEDFTGSYKEHFEIVSEVSTRDQTGFEKTFSGLMKILYPHGQATPDEVEELLTFSMEARRRVREHILRIDDTFSRHDFVYRSLDSGRTVTVLTAEERQYPTFATPRMTTHTADSDELQDEEALEQVSAQGDVAAEAVSEGPKAGHVVVPENTKGWSYRRLFAKHLRGAQKVVIRDPYVRLFFQARNVMEFLEMIHDLVPEGDEVAVHLVTQSDAESCIKQEEHLNHIVEAFIGSRIAFSWELDHSPNFHARSITSDTGWKITIDRGLDIFQKYETGPFSLEQALQEARLTRGLEVTYIRNEE
ncbi:MAG: ATP-dependent Lon protease, partial [Deltaproteobacteria bacterium]|nr:ATP-dependent Lon protease [Deltaproteobacteria bacterium]